MACERFMENEKLVKLSFRTRQKDCINFNEPVKTIDEALSQVEYLYELIEKEVTISLELGQPSSEKKIEKWAVEIERICDNVNNASVSNLYDLHAKTNFNLMLISHSMMDRDALKIFSKNIITAINEFQAD